MHTHARFAIPFSGACSWKLCFAIEYEWTRVAGSLPSTWKCSLSYVLFWGISLPADWWLLLGPSTTAFCNMPSWVGIMICLAADRRDAHDAVLLCTAPVLLLHRRQLDREVWRLTLPVLRVLREGKHLLARLKQRQAAPAAAAAPQAAAGAAAATSGATAASAQQGGGSTSAAAVPSVSPSTSVQQAQQTGDNDLVGLAGQVTATLCALLSAYAAHLTPLLVSGGAMATPTALAAPTKWEMATRVCDSACMGGTTAQAGVGGGTGVDAGSTGGHAGSTCGSTATKFPSLLHVLRCAAESVAESQHTHARQRHAVQLKRKLAEHNEAWHRVSLRVAQHAQAEANNIPLVNDEMAVDFGAGGVDVFHSMFQAHHLVTTLQQVS